MSYQRAIVIGSGIGGLMTARVLSDHFKEVLLLDRDDIPTEPVIRGGVPQASHFHGILPGGLEIMTRYFPGFDEELEAAGSLTPQASQFYVFTPEGKSYNLMRFQPDPSPPLPGFPKTHIQTRALLEHCLRQRVQAVANIETRYSTMIREPMIENDRVVGVKVDETGESIGADLVIDATGRVSRTLGWMDTMGFERPQESYINCDFAYTTVFFQPNDPELFTDVGFFVGTQPEGEFPRRGGGLVRMENGTWLATLAGRLDDHPPKTMDGFMDYAATLLEPWFHELLTQANPVTDPHHFKFPRGVRRHYERLTRYPEGLLPIADAICHYNPVYGQGMSAACRQAAALGELIEERKDQDSTLDGLWQPYFAQAFEQTRAPWLFAAMADLTQEGTTGDFPTEEAESMELIGKLAALSADGNQDATLLLASIGAMREPLSALHDPDTREALSI